MDANERYFFIENQAKKSYALLLKENGLSAAMISLLIVMLWYGCNRFILHLPNQNPLFYALGYLYFAHTRHLNLNLSVIFAQFLRVNHLND